MKDELLEKVARAMCEADGNDPDSVEWVVPEPQTFGGGDVIINGETGQKWMQYRRMAKRHIYATGEMFEWLKDI